MKHLYEVGVSYGILIVVAESKDEVLSIIKASKWYEIDFECLSHLKTIENLADIEKQQYIDKTILNLTTEIVGYEVKGDSKIIAYYQE